MLRTLKKRILFEGKNVVHFGVKLNMKIFFKDQLIKTRNFVSKMTFFAFLVMVILCRGTIAIHFPV